MSSAPSTLHLFCGKIAAGKSTLARNLASAPATVLITEDRWLSRLFPGEVQTLADYVRCSARLRDPMGDHVVELLRAGLSVVLDFQANTVSARQWMRALIDQSDCDHVLHVLDVPDGVCKQRMLDRNAAGGHEFAPGEADFELVTSFYAPPTPSEDFRIQMHRFP